MSAPESLSDQARLGLIVTFTCSAIAAIATVLRFISNGMPKAGYHADDWFMLVTLVTFWAAAGVSIWGLFEANGLPELAELTTDPVILAKTNKYLLANFWGVTVVWLSGYFLKISICLFYRRALSDVVYRNSAFFLIGLSTLWVIATELSNLVACVPIRKRWHLELPYPCPVNFNVMYLTTGCIETIIDAAVLAVPIKVVLWTQMSLQTRLTVVGMFLLGGFAVVTDIIRMIYIYRPGSKDINFEASQLWISIHMAVSILSACLPVYGPLWAKTTVFSKRVCSSFSSLFLASTYFLKFCSFRARSSTNASSQEMKVETAIINAQKASPSLVLRDESGFLCDESCHPQH